MRHSSEPHSAQHALASVIALWTLTAAECVGRATPLAYLSYVFALDVVMGLLLAGLLHLALHRLPRVRWFGRALLPALATLGGYALADGLGAFARLDGTYRGFAIAVLCASAVGAGSLSALLLLAQDGPGGRAGFLYRTSAPLRAGIALSLCGAAAVLVAADRTLYVALYPIAHLALRLCATLTLTLGLGLVLPSPRFTWRAGLPGAIVACAVLSTLDERDDVTLQAFAERPQAATLLRLARGLLDADRDGFSALLGGGDCDDWNPNIFPAAREVPGNGIDDNCYLGDAAVRSPIIEPPRPAKGTAPLSVVLITVDTLRWDRLGSNNPASGAMPHLQAFAEQGVNFERAYAPGSWTSISLGALMRGRYPRKLTWAPYFETSTYRMLRAPLTGQLQPDEQPSKMFPLSWDDPHPPLPVLLRDRRMKTIAVVDDGFSLMLAPEVGAARGFQVFEQVSPGTGAGRVGDAQTSDAAIEQLRWAERGRPFFLWIHYFGPHAPDEPHRETDVPARSLSDGYDNEVRFVDAQIGRVLDALTPVLDRTAVFVTADHGEEFFPTYRSHGMDLREALIRIPMVARVPGWKAARVAQPVSLLDLMPTILALTATPAPSGLDGIDLRSVLDAEGAKRPTQARRTMFIDNWYYNQDGIAIRDDVGAHDGDRKLILDRLHHSFSLIDQQRGAEQRLPEGPLGAPHLLRGLMAYVEETGGRLSLVD